MAKSKGNKDKVKVIEVSQVVTKEVKEPVSVPRLIGNKPVIFLGNGLNRFLKRKKKIVPASQAQRFIDKGYGSVVNE